MKPARASMLLRDFIQDRLYFPDQGYFTKPQHQLGQLRQPLKYPKLDGVHDYFEALGRSYPEFAFLTPVEIFQPWYGYSLAHYFMKKNAGAPVKLVEIGGGTGTAALSILDFYKRNHQQTYERIQYTVVELSPVIAEACLYRLSQAHPDLVSSKRIQVITQSAFDFSQKYSDPCFVFALEVLDNLPHDLVQFNESTKQWDQLRVEVTEEGGMKECFEPVSDPVVQDCLSLYQSLSAPSNEEMEQEEREGLIYTIMKYISGKKKTHNRVFLPTGSLLLFQRLHGLMPKADYLLADFDFLKGSQVIGANAPIVQSKGKLSHEKEDFDTVLVNRGQADIMFPTNFRLLQHMFRSKFGKPGNVFKTHRFMQEFAKAKWTETRSGYKPLLDDFHNTSVFLTQA